MRKALRILLIGVLFLAGANYAKTIDKSTYLPVNQAIFMNLVPNAPRQTTPPIVVPDTPITSAHAHKSAYSVRRNIERNPIVRVAPKPVTRVVSVVPRGIVAPDPTVGPDPRAYALSVLGRIQYNCIDQIFSRESHWNYRAYNSGSGAYGIPQALPGSKMSAFGADWRTNPITQVRWGINYIKERYGNSCNALRWWNGHGWY